MKQRFTQYHSTVPPQFIRTLRCFTLQGFCSTLLSGHRVITEKTTEDLDVAEAPPVMRDIIRELLELAGLNL